MLTDLLTYLFIQLFVAFCLVNVLCYNYKVKLSSSLLKRYDQNRGGEAAKFLPENVLEAHLVRGLGAKRPLKIFK